MYFKIIIGLLFMSSVLSQQTFDGFYKRDSVCAANCSCWNLAQIVFEELDIPVFLINGTFRGDCEGKTRYTMTNYTYTDGDNWSQFWSDVNNGMVNITGGPFCSYGDYIIQTSQSYWNNETQYWQQDLTFVNVQQPRCSYHMKNVTQPSTFVEPVPQPEPQEQNQSEPIVQPQPDEQVVVSPNVLNGLYNLTSECDPNQCQCWEQIHFQFYNASQPSYTLNGTLFQNLDFGFNCPVNGSYADLLYTLQYQYVNLINYTVYINFTDNNTESGKVRAEQIMLQENWNLNCSSFFSRIPQEQSVQVPSTWISPPAISAVENYTQNQSGIQNYTQQFQQMNNGSLIQWWLNNQTNSSNNGTGVQNFSMIFQMFNNMSVPGNQTNFSMPIVFNNQTNFANFSMPIVNNQSNVNNFSVPIFPPIDQFNNASVPVIDNSTQSSDEDDNQGGVYDYFNGMYKLQQDTPCNFSLGCHCWKNLYLMNVVPEDNSEPYILFNGTFQQNSHSVPATKIQKLFYPAIWQWEPAVNLTSSNNLTQLQLSMGNEEFNNQSQMYYYDITIQDINKPQCVYNMTNLTGLYYSLNNFIENKIKYFNKF